MSDDFLDDSSDEVRAFFDMGPISYILAVVVGALVAAYGYALGLLTAYWNAVATAITDGLFGPIIEAGSSGRVLFEMWEALAEVAGNITAELGLFAPLGVMFVWLIGVALTAIITLAALRVLNTYLPLNAIPFIGRYIR